jgi:hypothetical protein
MQSLVGGSRLCLVRVTRRSSVPMTTRFTYTPPPLPIHTHLYYAFQKHTSEAQIISRETRALVTITAGTATLQMCCSHDVVRKYVYNI